MKPSRGVNPPFIISSTSQSCRCESVTDGSSNASIFRFSASSPVTRSGFRGAPGGGCVDGHAWSPRCGAVERGRDYMDRGASVPNRRPVRVASGGPFPGVLNRRQARATYVRFYTLSHRPSHGSGRSGSTWRNSAPSTRAVSAARALRSGVASAPTAERGIRSRKASRRPAGRARGRRRRPAGPVATSSVDLAPDMRTGDEPGGARPGARRRARGGGRWCSSAASPGSASLPCCSRCWPASPAPAHGPST